MPQSSNLLPLIGQRLNIQLYKTGTQEMNTELGAFTTLLPNVPTVAELKVELVGLKWKQDQPLPGNTQVAYSKVKGVPESFTQWQLPEVINKPTLVQK
jgi:hypothetical protein